MCGQNYINPIHFLLVFGINHQHVLSYNPKRERPCFGRVFLYEKRSFILCRFPFPLNNENRRRQLIPIKNAALKSSAGNIFSYRSQR